MDYSTDLSPISFFFHHLAPTQINQIDSAFEVTIYKREHFCLRKYGKRVFDIELNC